jgi:hypothetical protein
MTFGIAGSRGAQPLGQPSGFSARRWQAARNGNKRRQWAAMIYPAKERRVSPRRAIAPGRRTFESGNGNPDQI